MSVDHRNQPKSSNENVVNIVLIDVGADRSELNEPLAIETLAGVLRNTYPSQVKVDMDYLQLSGERGFYDYSSYEIIGLSTKINALNRIEGVLDSLRKSIHGRRQIVVLGGLTATFAYEQLLERYPNVFCVVGEGEEALEGITRAVVAYPEADLQELQEIIIRVNVPNIAMKHNSKVTLTERKLATLEKIPKPSRDFLRTVVNQRGLVRLEASRGCSWGHCTFCGITAKYSCPKWRPFPIKRIIEDLKEISACGGRNPYFTDEDFFGDNPLRGKEIAKAILEEKQKGTIAPDLQFYLNIPAQVIGENQLVLQELKKAGLREVFIGLESGSKTQLRRYGKKATVDDNIKAVQTLRKLGLSMDVGFMMFDPEMNVQELGENLKFLEKLNLIEHGERDIKRVRIEPKTPLELRLKRTEKINKLNPDNLSYPYEFHDRIVQEIVKQYEAWEEPAKGRIYYLQALTRGEMERQSQYRLRKLLGKFRKLDFEYLKALILQKTISTNISLSLLAINYERDVLLTELDSIIQSCVAANELSICQQIIRR